MSLIRRSMFPGPWPVACIDRARAKVRSTTRRRARRTRPLAVADRLIASMVQVLLPISAFLN